MFLCRFEWINGNDILIVKYNTMACCADGNKRSEVVTIAIQLSTFLAQ